MTLPNKKPNKNLVFFIFAAQTASLEISHFTNITSSQDDRTVGVCSWPLN